MVSGRKNGYVVDSSIFNKLFLKESGRSEAISFFKKNHREKISMIAPSLSYYEIMNTARRYEVEMDIVYEVIESQEKAGFSFIHPKRDQIEKAIEITKMGHVKRGYPGFWDSVFHAMAILENRILVTADYKHYEKVKSLGYIETLL